MKNRLVNSLKKYPKQFLRRLNSSANIMTRRKEIIIYEEVWLSQNEYQRTAFRLILTELTIMDKTSNLAPTIYLDGYFNDYNCGEPMSDICRRILKVYEENKVTDNFDVSMVTDFSRARNRICCKLINAERNVELLGDVPVRYMEEERDNLRLNHSLIKRRQYLILS